MDARGHLQTMNNSSSKPSGDAFASLYPAIVQCFTIILLGYVTGRGGWINATHAKGLNTFTSKFALPSLLFSSMATLDWTKVEWTFLSAIFISKASLFLMIGIFTLIIRRPTNIGLAALAGIFVTQSNDFALGYPIVNAVYGQTQPQFLQYIYLIAPINLLILNPIGFVMLELHKASSQNTARSNSKLVKNVCRQMLFNPIIVMTALGVAANFIFNHNLPDILEDLLNTLGQSFSACALFILGLSIVGKFNKTMTPLLMGSGMLIFAKLLLFPLMATGITRALNCGVTTNSTAEYSMFAFLYGTFPTAPSVYLYASDYAIGTDLVATSLVLGTVISAPLMFTSAMMFGMQILSMDASILSDTSFDVAVLALLCTVLVVLLFTLTRRATRMPHLMVLLIAMFQLLVAIGSIMESNSIDGDDDTISPAWKGYIVFILHFTGVVGVSTMTSVTAITIYLISSHSLCRSLVFRPWLLSYGLGTPVLLVCSLFFIGHFTTSTATNSQIKMGVTAGVMIVNIIITITALVKRHRHSHSRVLTPAAVEEACCSERLSGSGSVACESSSLVSKPSIGYGSTRSLTSSYTSNKASNCSPVNGPSSCRHYISESEKESLLPSIEDIVTLPVNSGVEDDRMCQQKPKCSTERRAKCKGHLADYDQTNQGNVYIYDYQIGRTTVLLVLLLLSQITVSFYYLWKVLLPDLKLTNLFIEMEFIYIVFCTGQGLFTFLTFGLDCEVVLLPIKKLILRAVNRGQSVETSSEDIDDEMTDICRQFSTHHLRHCIESIDRIHSAKRDCFNGASMVRWLVDAGLAADSTDAVIYAERLLAGGIIQTCSKRGSTFHNTKRNMYQFGKPLLLDTKSQSSLITV